MLPIVNEPLIYFKNYDKHYKALVKRQKRMITLMILTGNYASFLLESSIAVQHKNGTMLGRGDHNSSNRLYILCITKEEIITAATDYIFCASQRQAK